MACRTRENGILLLHKGEPKEMGTENGNLPSWDVQMGRNGSENEVFAVR